MSRLPSACQLACASTARTTGAGVAGWQIKFSGNVGRVIVKGNSAVGMPRILAGLMVIGKTIT